jgi:cytochrome c-type biogenesis protein CcsB
MGSFSSMTMFNVTAFGYFAALFAYIGNLASRKPGWRRLATLLASGGFLAQAVGLALRWYEAGLVEVAAYERAEGVTLAGMKWFVVFAQHPPWANLYEIMVFMSYGLVLVVLVMEVKYKIQLVALFGLTVALVALGLASLTIDPTLKPLVPALQSYWLHVHVITSVVGYAAGTTAAVAGLFFLFRDRVNPHKLALGFLSVGGLVVFILGRGTLLLTSLEYQVKLLRLHGDQLVPAMRMAEAGGDMKTLYVASPGVGPLMLLSLAACVVGIAYMALHRRDPATSLRGPALWFYLVPLLLMTATVVLMVVNNLGGAAVALPLELARHATPGPYRLGLQSNQWDLALLFLTWAPMWFGLVGLAKPEVLDRMLPEPRLLDRAVYTSVMVAFAMVALVLVTGALWAHYAWGRYWGWDPKETGALVIWFVYAVYLHARITYGWVGRPSAAIAVAGFFVIIAGFLGVNLGWFADGLHSYGAG